MTTPLRGRHRDDYWPTRWATIENRVSRGVPKDFRRGDLTKTFENKADHGTVRRLFDFVVGQGTPQLWCEDSLIGEPETAWIAIDGGTYVEKFRATRASVEHAYMAFLITKASGAASPAAFEISRALEIGGGFGGLALKVLETSEPITYELVDTAALLKIQDAYLTRAGYAENIVTSTPAAFLEGDHRYELAIATRCLGEMPAETARRYVQEVHRRLNPGGLFFVVSWLQKVSTWTDLGLEALPWTLQDVRQWPRDIDPNPMNLGFFVK